MTTGTIRDLNEPFDRWAGVRPETKDALVQLAQTPRKEKVDKLFDTIYKHISVTYHDPIIQRTLLIMLEGAITAHDYGKPRCFLEGEPYYTTG